ncbi:MAG: PVC-type heme-binding CxxCH protein [Prosthecobacter sp.]|uniref:PVC-type heme-binding CxxCH protein n=1 Tax=Prosthecobacter sp. TaxID=1965333 RepID=UPI003BB1131B
MQRRLIAWLALTSCASFICQAADELKFPTTPPTEPQNAAKTFHVLDGFQMQLIAAEPLVTDPVAITYDEDGRAYVCEMNDYPYTDKEHHKHAQENPTDQSIGKVRLLTDTDGDGVFDKATVFAEGLSWPTGAACWKGGIFVTATPDVWYLKDTNGDGVADVRQKVFTGFKKLNVQAVMNNPIWGLDHRIYVAGGSNGGEIQRAPGSESVMPLPADFKPLSIKRNDFSFDPSTGDVRLESGGARFGNTFDDWGNRFLCNIRNPCQHVVLPYRYLARNPYLVVPSALNDCAEAGDQLPVYRTSPPEPWREFRAKRWVQEGSTLPKSELVGAGVVTSSAGITVYRGDAYPPEYHDFVFVADVAGNLFYRMKLVPDGVTFKAVQVDGNKNFCTSDDLWCRPVNFVNAPDGCLHVCDMYREIIEHPWSIPDDIHAAVDLLRGRDQGRLFRLAPKTFQPRPTPKLSTATTPALVALLDHPNAWHRETAQRLLFEKQDKAAVEPLRAMVKVGKTPQGKEHALWGLHGLDHGASQQWTIPLPPEGSDPQGIDRKKAQLGQLPQFLLDEVLNAEDTNEHLASSAWNLKAEFVAKTPPAYQRFNDEVLVMRTSRIEPGTQALMWAAFALGEAGFASDYYPERLIYLIRNGRGDPWLGIAAELSAASMSPAQVLGLFAFGPATGAPLAYYRIIRNSAAQIARSPKDCKSVLEFLDHVCADRQPVEGHAFVPDAIIEHILVGLSVGLGSKGAKLQSLNPSERVLAWMAARASMAVSKLSNRAESMDERNRQIPLLAMVPPDKAISTLMSLIKPDELPELQLAALEALGSYREPAVADMLIDAWPKLTPALRDKAASILLSRTDRIAKLLDAIEAKKILPSQLSAATKATLGRQKAPALADRIAKLIGDGGSSNRKEVITKYEPVLSMTGDPAHGAKIYETLCMVCHRHLDRGNDVGPNLGTIKAWTAEQILTNVLDPNREVSPNFALYIVETNDGRALSGLITSETAGNLTLKCADGGTDTVLRSEIKSLTSPGISLMPEGLEAAITPQQMADLIAYLKQ